MWQPMNGRCKTTVAKVRHRRIGKETIPMGLFINGRWSGEQRVDDHKGRFVRAKTQYHHWVGEAGTRRYATSLNPKRIVPLGPTIDFNATHDRERFN
jgi:glutathionyl-hydroquinone reductase